LPGVALSSALANMLEAVSSPDRSGDGHVSVTFLCLWDVTVLAFSQANRASFGDEPVKIGGPDGFSHRL